MLGKAILLAMPVVVPVLASAAADLGADGAGILPGGPVLLAQIDKSLPTYSRQYDPIPYDRSRVFFAAGSVDLSPFAKKILTSQARIMLAYPQTRYRIVGRTDTRERATSDGAIGLGYRRAAQVRDFLIAKGVPAERLQIGSRGDEGIIVVHETEEGMAGMRSVDTEFLDSGDRYEK